MMDGKQLRMLREAAGYTQKQLATLIGTSDKSISDWERGQHKAPRSALLLIDKILGVRSSTITVEANNIRLLRREKGLTQKALAAKTGLAEITIRNYEAGKYRPKAAQLEKLSTALECSIGDILMEPIAALPTLPSVQTFAQPMGALRLALEEQQTLVAIVLAAKQILDVWDVYEETLGRFQCE